MTHSEERHCGLRKVLLCAMPRSSRLEAKGADNAMPPEFGLSEEFTEPGNEEDSAATI